MELITEGGEHIYGLLFRSRSISGASAGDWQEANARCDSAVADLPAALRDERPRGSPHPVWELMEYIRQAQRDILDFCRDSD